MSETTGDAGKSTNAAGSVGDNVASAAYRAVADERTPKHLNRAVLEHAAQAVRKKSTYLWPESWSPTSWLRPVTFAATVALSLTLALQFGDFQLPGAAEHDAESGIAEADNPDGANKFDRAAETAMQQIRAAEIAAESEPGSPESSVSRPGEQPTDITRQDSVGRSATDRADIKPLSDFSCTAVERSTTASWWRCIESLESRGHTDAATQEIEALFAAYPAYGINE